MNISSLLSVRIRGGGWMLLVGAWLLAAMLSFGHIYGATVDTGLPPGVAAVWDISKAYRETTPTRERICLNGLWRWQPAGTQEERAPEGNWGYFKVPGSWPGITDYMQKDAQRVFTHPAWQNENLGRIRAAWSEREITIPAEWSGRRIELSLEYLNSFARVFIDGRMSGEVQFPGGTLDVTSACQPGRKHRLSVLVVAMPLKGVLLSYSDSASAKEVQGGVARRGLCGDVFLVSTPRGPRLEDVKVETSVREKRVTVEAAVGSVPAGASYVLRARVNDGGQAVHRFSSPIFQAKDLADGRVRFSSAWKTDKLWDLHTSTNLLELEVSLLDDQARMLDAAWNTRFGFREFWIEGRDFILNGKRLFLSCVPFDNAQVSAALASYAGARESLERLKAIGINYVYTHNYGCEPGSHLGFEEILRAADDVGMLVGFSQPHFSHYDWSARDAARSNGYARHASFYVRAAQNHPSVVMYSMSHNATGYSEDMNPDLMGRDQAPRDSWAKKNVDLARRAEAIVRELDPSRIVYHHASGDLGAMHNVNFYPNFVPIQELSDWFEGWSKEGVKPVFTCEYGAPFTWDWTMYRGWFNGKREFGSAKVPWDFSLAEWNAQFVGDAAYRISEAERANVRWEAGQFREGKTWQRWDYPNPVGSDRFDERYPIFARYTADNWRAFRTLGVSGISPWEHEHFWRLKPGVSKAREEFLVDWENLQRPGFSPDFQDKRYERMDMAFARSDWEATPAAEALMRNNRPLLAYLGGKAAAVTSKDHNFRAGETVEKQAVVINNSREEIVSELEWAFGEPPVSKGKERVRVVAGGQARVPIRFEWSRARGELAQTLSLTARFGDGTVQEDRFDIHLVTEPEPFRSGPRMGVFDPKGKTLAWLKRAGVAAESINASADPGAFDVLIIGKGALTSTGPAPELKRVRDGMKVLVFEQTAEGLEKRLGLRVQEYGLRQMFPRVTGHAALRGLATEHLQDWRGESTLLPARLKYTGHPQLGPTVQWNGLTVPHLWRSGNRGTVASVLIEKPARGDFLPVLDGGFSLQYAAVLEFREGNGVVVFCQADVTGRTEEDPAAGLLAHNLVRYVSEWNPGSRRTLLYAGEPAGRTWLEQTGFQAGPYQGGLLRATDLLVISPGSLSALAPYREAIRQSLSEGRGHVLALGLNEQEAAGWSPEAVRMRREEHLATWFAPFAVDSMLTGVGPADVHNRDPREVSLIASGAEIFGNGVLAQSAKTGVVFCQFVPWKLENRTSPNVRRTYRRWSFALNRLLGNQGVPSATPLLERFSKPVEASERAPRLQDGFYCDTPVEWDDPYRFFRW